VCQKNPHRIAELKTSIQSETEAISTENLTMIPKSFAFRSHKVLRGISHGTHCNVTNTLPMRVEQSVKVS
jgi:hypothetical protein